MVIISTEALNTDYPEGNARQVSKVRDPKLAQYQQSAYIEPIDVISNKQLLPKICTIFNVRKDILLSSETKRYSMQCL